MTLVYSRAWEPGQLGLGSEEHCLRVLQLCYRKGASKAGSTSKSGSKYTSWHLKNRCLHIWLELHELGILRMLGKMLGTQNSCGLFIIAQS